MVLTHEERRMLLQSLLNALDKTQHYHLLLSLAKNQQKINYQEQVVLWQNKAKDLQLTSALN